MDVDSDLLKLWLTPGLGAAKLQQLLAHFESPKQLLRANVSTLEQIGLSREQIDTLQSDRLTPLVQQHMEWQQQSPLHQLISIDSTHYPDRLKEIPRAPIILCVKGHAEVLHDPQLGMVGSRNPTHSGKDTAFQFARYLSGMGITITSGLATGIDGDSHHGALAADAPTLAVVGTGLNSVYPAKHKDLAQAIMDHGGALISEYPLDSGAHPSHFPQRNRIISGLSLGVLVVEAALKSGSLITARFAREQGREVFAIPGSIHNPLAKGCHALIKQGAKLVESADDLLEELAPQLQPYLDAQAPLETNPSCYSDFNEMQATQRLSDDQQQLLDQLSYSPMSIDQISQSTGLSSQDLASMLLIMELEGFVSSEAGGKFMRRK